MSLCSLTGRRKLAEPIRQVWDVERQLPLGGHFHRTAGIHAHMVDLIAYTGGYQISKTRFLDMKLFYMCIQNTLSLMLQQISTCLHLENTENQQRSGPLVNKWQLAQVPRGLARGKKIVRSNVPLRRNLYLQICFSRFGATNVRKREGLNF